MKSLRKLTIQNFTIGILHFNLKSFIKENVTFKKQTKNYIFYTTEGTTFQPLTTRKYPDYPDVENCQILGWAKGCNPKEAFETFKIESPWLFESSFDEVLVSELKDEKTCYFYLKSQ